MTDPFREREARYFLIGWLVLEGVSTEKIGSEWGVTPEIIEEGWRVSQEQLSLELSMEAKEPFRLRSLEELRGELERCRLMLFGWRERLLMPEPSVR